MKKDNAALKKRKNSFSFILFVAGDEPHSTKARHNFPIFCEKCIAAPYKLTVLDVFESYAAALKHNIYLTPALVMLTPAPRVTVFGDLSDTDELIRALRLEGVD